jgi:hypothetical protein
MTTTEHDTAALDTETTHEAEGQTTDEKETAPILGGEVERQQQESEGEKKPEGDQPAEGDADGEAKAPAPEGAPEAYELKAPEGQEFDKAVLGGFEEVAREQNLTNDTAQAILTKVAPLLEQRAAEQKQEILDGWAKELAADKEIGGDKLDENLAVGDKAIAEFGDEELIELLQGTGLIGAPAVVRAFVKIGQRISEDSIHTGAPSVPKDENLNDPAVINRRMGWDDNPT